MADTQAVSHVDDHPFVPRTEWWSLCKICGIAESAHQKTSLKPSDRKMGAS